MNRITPLLEYHNSPVLTGNPFYHPISSQGTPGEPIMHNHDYTEICLIRSGVVTVIADNIYTTMQSPCLILYNRNCQHAQFNASSTVYEKYMIILRHNHHPSLHLLCQQICSHTEQSAMVIPMTVSAMDWLFRLNDHLMDLLLTEKIGPDDKQFLLPFGYLLSEIEYILDNHTQVQENHNNPLMMKALAYISEHLTEKITLNDISDYTHMGKTKLTKDFRQYFSMSVHQYILCERLALAQNYLDMDYTVDEVAKLCGFGNSTHFIQTFKRTFSVTPTQYKKRKMEEK